MIGGDQIGRTLRSQDGPGDAREWPEFCASQAMFKLWEGSRRRHIKRAGHDTWMSFDPEARKDPFREGFRGLQGFDEDRLAPGIGARSQARQDMEILTYVVDGALLHEDDLGKARVI